MTLLDTDYWEWCSGWGVDGGLVGGVLMGV